MRITWYGHAAFLIETKGVRIILDPYRSPDCGGYEPVADRADLVVVSHENDRYHSHLGQIVPTFETVRALEIPPQGTVKKGIRFESVRVFETPERLPEDEVAIIHFRSEDLHLVFLGDLGHPLKEAEMAPIRGADIVLAAAAAHASEIDAWHCSPVNVGGGTVDCAHGTLPVPAPATLALLGDAPVYAAGPPMERVTPTGATILRMLDVQYASLPTLRIKASGYGAGGRDTPGQPNILRLLVGEEQTAQQDTEPIAILETVIDDSSPQLIAYVSELLLQSGAWDVYRISVQMKKGRTGTQLTVLCSPDLMPALRDLLFRETTTIGAHWRTETKMALQRDFAEVQTPWGLVKIKIARTQSGELTNAAPEYEDCRRIAELHKVPLKQVMFEAARLYAAAQATDRKESDGSAKDRGVAE